MHRLGIPFINILTMKVFSSYNQV